MDSLGYGVGEDPSIVQPNAQANLPQKCVPVPDGRVLSGTPADYHPPHYHGPRRQSQQRPQHVQGRPHQRHAHGRPRTESRLLPTGGSPDRPPHSHHHLETFAHKIRKEAAPDMQRHLHRTHLRLLLVYAVPAAALPG